MQPCQPVFLWRNKRKLHQAAWSGQKPLQLSIYFFYLFQLEHTLTQILLKQRRYKDFESEASMATGGDN